jgi:hypothetical protein
VRYEPEELFELGDDQFVVSTRVWGCGRARGIEIDQRRGFLYTLGPSGVSSLVCYPSTDEALAAAEPEPSR